MLELPPLRALLFFFFAFPLFSGQFQMSSCIQFNSILKSFCTLCIIFSSPDIQTNQMKIFHIIVKETDLIFSLFGFFLQTLNSAINLLSTTLRRVVNISNDVWKIEHIRHMLAFCNTTYWSILSHS